ncbi:hypothetical protein [Rhodomicrobium vannielii]|uniref:hypothetical protein n=1 Tax=Rhodomicrobium vannielii TaxID=1069 RepID=UPI003D7C144D
MSTVFVAEALPDADEATQRLPAELIEATLTGEGSSFSEVARCDVEIASFAGAMADMFCGSAMKLPAMAAASGRPMFYAASYQGSA